MRVADQLIGLAMTAGFPAELPASICGNALLNMDGWYCRMPSSSQTDGQGKLQLAAQVQFRQAALLTNTGGAGDRLRRAADREALAHVRVPSPALSGTNTTLKMTCRFGKRNSRITRAE